MRFSSLAMASAAVLAAPLGAATSPRDAASAEVRAVLGKYKAAVERLDASGTEALFASDSMVFESGGNEGTYAQYLAHHLKPELAAFRSFKFSNYVIAVRFEGAAALVTETYKFRIEPKTGDVAERLGVATSVLRKTGGKWTIVLMHTSSRRISPG